MHDVLSLEEEEEEEEDEEEEEAVSALFDVSTCRRLCPGDDREEELSPQGRGSGQGLGLSLSQELL